MELQFPPSMPFSDPLASATSKTVFFSDYVYVETTPNSPYLIRRIEELNKNQTGNVEAKVMCFYRRRDLPNPLVQLADKHQREYRNPVPPKPHPYLALRLPLSVYIYCQQSEVMLPRVVVVAFKQVKS